MFYFFFRDSSWWILLVVVTIISFGTRLHKVDEPDHVWYVLFNYNYIIFVFIKFNYLDDAMKWNCSESI